jgi:hypothetical protein
MNSIHLRTAENFMHPCQSQLPVSRALKLDAP